MITRQPMRSVKAELTDWLGEDVVAAIKRRNAAGVSYNVIAMELRRESGFMVTGKQLCDWVYQSKKAK